MVFNRAKFPQTPFLGSLTDHFDGLPTTLTYGFRMADLECNLSNSSQICREPGAPSSCLAAEGLPSILPTPAAGFPKQPNISVIEASSGFSASWPM